MKKIFALFLLVFFYLNLTGCGTSITPTSDRYKKSNEDLASESKAKDAAESKDSSEEKVPDKKNELIIKHPNLKEDFDITPYKTKLTVKEEKTTDSDQSPDVWVEYERKENKIDNSAPSTRVMPGYRVQVATTDNLDEANSTRSEVYFKIKQPVYVIYDSPFYKVRAGDFLDNTRAKDLNFKLNQLGYKDSRVVQDSVNIVK